MNRRPVHLFLLLFLTGAGHLSVGQESNVYSIDEAVERAIAGSAHLHALRAKEVISRARYRGGVRAFFPEISLRYGANDSVSYFGPDARTKQIGVGIEHQLYDGGYLLHERRVMQAHLQISEIEYERAVDSLRVAVVSECLNYLTQRQEEIIILKALQSAREHERIAGMEAASGIITQVELEELGLEAKELEIAAVEKSVAVQLSETRLANLVEMENAEAVRIAGEIYQEYGGFLGDESPETLMEMALAENLELRRQRLETVAREQAVERLRRGWIPSVRANAEFRLSGTEFPLSERGFSVGLAFAFRGPVIPTEVGVTASRQGELDRSSGVSGTTRPGEDIDGIYRQRIAALEEAESRRLVADLESELHFAVREESARVQDVLSRLSLSRQRHAIDIRRLELERIRFSAGEIDRRDLLEKEIAVAQSEIGIVRGVVNLFGAEVALLERLGIAIPPGVYQEVITSPGWKDET